MKIVGTEPDVVETVLCAGGFSCPNCPGALRPWVHGSNVTCGLAV